MSVVNKGLSAAGKLGLLAIVIAIFLIGFFAVGYIQLRGEEVTIPNIVGKNFNDGTAELERNGLRIRKVGSRYSQEKPNTVLEQRPKAGSVAKTGLIISVFVAQPNQDGTEAPADLKDDEEAIEEIEALPELKTEPSKSKRKKSKPKPKKTATKNRDVIESEKKDDVEKKDGVDTDSTKEEKKGDKTVKPLYTPAKKKPSTPKPAVTGRKRVLPIQ